MKLIPVEDSVNPFNALFRLLAERPQENNISHSEMPTWEEHCRFVRNHPYEAFYLIDVDRLVVGKIYLTFPPAAPSLLGNEVGFDIFREHQRKGYATRAIKMLMKAHGPRRYLFNVSPRNEASRALLESLGGELIQHTYELRAAA